ncbi:hypothetical protein ACHAXA_005061 [Cyclostephanos tholiformis]|uniref:RRM domain-containing protein n=1 Tax=Cyclostephanos tholiformis TaxID=382380 RepID=A0ABD3SRS6_9STRA
MRVSGSNGRNRVSKSSRLVEANNRRLRTAGRPGTINFVDPTKVFVGNLPYDAVESDLTLAFAEYWNVDATDVDRRIRSVRVIRDWKTGKGRGYGFVQFYDAMDATSAMEGINGLGAENGGGGKRRGGDDLNDVGGGIRRVGGKTKGGGNAIKKREEDLDEEGRVIYAALGGKEDGDDEGNESSSSSVVDGKKMGADLAAAAEKAARDEGIMSEDDMIAFMERGGLRGAMALTEETAGYLGVKGLYVQDDDDEDEIDGELEEESEDFDFEAYYNQNGYRDGDYGDIDIDNDEEEEDDDGSEMTYDGVFEEIYDPNEYEGLTEEEEANMAKMNREQRRAAEKRRKKRKLPFRGFGKQA